MRERVRQVWPDGGAGLPEGGRARVRRALREWLRQEGVQDSLGRLGLQASLAAAVLVAGALLRWLPLQALQPARAGLSLAFGQDYTVTAAAGRLDAWARGQGGWGPALARTYLGARERVAAWWPARAAAPPGSGIATAPPVSGAPGAGIGTGLESAPPGPVTGVAAPGSGAAAPAAGWAAAPGPADSGPAAPGPGANPVLATPAPEPAAAGVPGPEVRGKITYLPPNAPAARGSGAPGTPPGQAVRPVPGAILLEYGWRGPPDRETLHEGLDLEAAPGTPVRAMWAGAAVRLGQADTGPFVEVDHGGGLSTRYAPVTPAVREGQKVAAGDVLGRVAAAAAGEPGKPHLHLEVRQGDVPVDPAPFLGAGPGL